MKRQNSASFVVVAIIALLGLVRPTVAGEGVPFKGGLEGTATRSPDPDDPAIVLVDVEGEGHASQVGQFTVSAPHAVDTATRTATGTYEFTAANGDAVTAEFTGTATPTATPGVLLIVETATITGGTGRFAGATGTFTVTRLYDPAAGTTSGSVEGTIASPGAGKA